MMKTRDVAAAVVLVVEDEPLQRMLIVDLIEEAGFLTVEVASAGEAIRVLEGRTDIRVVIADIDMPRGIDGMRLAASIRDRWPPIELIIISGQREPCLADLPSRSLFFGKPFIQARVREAVGVFVAGTG